MTMSLGMELASRDLRIFLSSASGAQETSTDMQAESVPTMSSARAWDDDGTTVASKSEM